MKRLRFALGLSFVLGLSACAGRTMPIVSNADLTVSAFDALPAPTVADITKGRDYHIGPFDRLSYSVFGIEGMEGKIQADASGHVSIPLVGSIAAAGLTPAELATTIEAGLRARYVRNPRVAVNVEETLSQTVAIDGEIREPGVYPVSANMTLIRAIASAKGVGEFAKLDDIVVFRTVDGKRFAALYNIEAIRRGYYPDPPIYANDVVVVGDSPARRLFKNLIQLTPLLTTPIIIALQKL